MVIRCYAAYKAGEKLREFHYEEPHHLGPMEAVIKISHCGICHSDIHLIDNDWQNSRYPLVPGHEIVGIVERLGDAVDGLQIGQRVGVGWQAGSCMRCEWCLRGEENLCADDVATAVGHYGGFADKVIVDSRFAFPIPAEIDSLTAAPLLCGGITVYSPLRRLAKASDKVGVIGIGGLGHFALQFAHALGCEVTAFSHTPDKAQEARQWGADAFVSSTEGSLSGQWRRHFDFLVTTVNVNLDWAMYLSMLRPNGRLIVVGAVPDPLEIPSGAIISGQKGVIASVIGSPSLIRDMLAFVVHHDIHARTEVIPWREINAAVDRVRQGNARYRIVLEID